MSVLARARAVPTALERGAFAVLVLLAVTLALGRGRPVADVYGSAVLTSTSAVLLLAVGLWLVARLAAGRRPRVPRRLAAPAAAWSSACPGP